MPIVIADLKNLIAHWDVGSITGLANNDPVSSVPDNIGSWNLTASTTLRPSYKTSGIDSLPSIEFDGTDDCVATSTTKSFSQIMLGSCMVLNVPSRKNYSSFAALSTGSGIPTYIPNWMLMGYANGDVIHATGGSNYVFNTSGPASNVKSILTSVTGITASFVKTNGLMQWQNGPIGTPIRLPSGNYYASSGRNSLAGSAFAGQWAEWVLWEETYLQEHLWIEGIFAAKYNIALPATHPFASGAPNSPPSSGAVRQVNIRGGADQ